MYTKETRMRGETGVLRMKRTHHIIETNAKM